MSCSRVSLLFVGATALVGSLFVLDLGTPALRGGRRLQWQSGTQMASNAGQVANNAGQMANNAGQFGSSVANQGGQMANGAGQMANNAGQFGSNVANQGGQSGGVFGDQGGQLANQGGQLASQGMGYGNRLANLPTFGSVFDFIPTPWKATIILLQVIFAVIYYCQVVSKYPFWMGPTPMSCQLQNEPAPCSICRVSGTNCCLSWLCPQARAAHTFDRTGTLEYWCGLIAMFLCPFCTLCYTNACTDLNPKLGGEYANPIMSALCTWCCFCCTIAQDAESLDAATGSQTEMCGVSGGMPAPYGMNPGMPPQMMMQQPYY